MQRRTLQEDLKHIARNMDEAQCILGDFNAVLYTGDRMAGTEVQLHEIQSFDECITTCELQEVRSSGPTTLGLTKPFGQGLTGLL